MGAAKSKVVDSDDPATLHTGFDRWTRRLSRDSLERRWSRKWSRKWSFDDVDPPSAHVTQPPPRPLTKQRASSSSTKLPLTRRSSFEVLEQAAQSNNESRLTALTSQRRHSTSDFRVIRRDKEMSWRPLRKRKMRKNLPPVIGPIYSHQIAIPVVEEVLMQPALPQKKEKGRHVVHKKNSGRQEPPSPFIVRKVPEVKTFYLSS